MGGRRRAPDQILLYAGTRIRERRDALHLSQEYLAAALGITRQQIQKYEANIDRIALDRLIRIAGILGVPPMRLMIEPLLTEPRLADPAPGQASGTAPYGVAERSSSGYAVETSAAADHARLFRTLSRVKDPAVRHRLLAFLCAFAEAAAAL